MLDLMEERGWSICNENVKGDEIFFQMRVGSEKRTKMIRKKVVRRGNLFMIYSNDSGALWVITGGE